MKYIILSLLAHAPNHGYELLQTYEALFGGVLPPLNAGQIYTTLARLERDGLVRDHTVEQTGKPDKRCYQLTDSGVSALQDWFAEPLTGPRIKDNFFLKLVGARLSELVSPKSIIEVQRRVYLQSLHELNLLSLKSDVAADQKRLVLIQGAILHLKADLEWLDLCEDAFG